MWCLVKGAVNTQMSGKVSWDDCRLHVTWRWTWIWARDDVIDDGYVLSTAAENYGRKCPWAYGAENHKVDVSTESITRKTLASAAD